MKPTLTPHLDGTWSCRIASVSGRFRVTGAPSAPEAYHALIRLISEAGLYWEIFP